jgi:hypothetical protein
MALSSSYGRFIYTKNHSDKTHPENNVVHIIPTPHHSNSVRIPEVLYEVPPPPSTSSVQYRPTPLPIVQREVAVEIVNERPKIFTPILASPRVKRVEIIKSPEFENSFIKIPVEHFQQQQHQQIVHVIKERPVKHVALREVPNKTRIKFLSAVIIR